MRPLARNCGASSCPIASYPRASARMAGNWESSRRTNACTPSRCHEASPKHFPSKDDPEMGGIAGTPFCRLEDGDCISKPTQFQINHSKPNQPIPTQPTTGWTGAAGGGPAGGWLGWNWLVWFGMVDLELGWFGNAIAVFQTAERGPRNSTHFRIILRLENAGPSVIQWTYAFRYSNSSVASSHGVRRGLPGRHSHAAQWSGGPGDLYGRHCSHRQDAGGRHRKNLRRDGHRHAAIHASGSNSFRDARAGPSPTRHDRRSRTEGARGVAA